MNGTKGGQRRRRLLVAAVLTGLIAVAGCTPSTAGSSAVTQPSQGPGAGNPDLDTGTPLGGAQAPDFRLTNQFGQQVSLSAFRGKVVILAFMDSQCTTICPLTTVSMLQAAELLGPAAGDVQLLAVDANPQATSVSDVLAYSQSHGMVNHWQFLTGTLPQLRAVWKAYHIYVQVQAGQIDHTPALYLIDQRGREQKVYVTAMAYASVSQSAQVLAQDAASLLPGDPKLAHTGSLDYLDGLHPTKPAVLPAASSGKIVLGPGHAHLLMFFATWLSQTSDLRARLAALNTYAADALTSGLPAPVAVDETATEPSADSVRAFLAHEGKPLDYPVALDTTGRLADGYGVQDQPYFVITSASGWIVWRHDGWLPVSALERAARRSLTRRS